MGSMNFFYVVIVAVYASFVVVLGAENSKVTPDWFYSLMVDAGSKGTRLIIYRWKPETRLPRKSIQIPEEIGFKSVNPGLSSFALTPNSVSASLAALISYATDVLEPIRDYVHLIPIYIKGTAGLRDLTPPARDSIMHETIAFLSDKALSPFYFKPNQAIVISGEEEGAFAWLSVNALKGVLGDPDSDKTYGVIDLGGASSQVAFIPESSHYILQNCYPLTLTDQCSYRTYSKSYLHYGLVEANRRLSSNIITENLLKVESVGEIENPCYYRDHQFEPDFSTLAHVPITVHMIGTGDFDKCFQELSNLFNKGIGIQCWVRDCTFDGVYQPRLDNRPFVGIGNIGKLLNYVGIPPRASLHSVKQTAMNICIMTYEQVKKKHSNVPERISQHLCFSLSYIYTLLTHGLGFQDHGNEASQIEFSNTINGAKVDWALGAIIHEANQQPPATISEYVRLTKEGPKQARTPELQHFNSEIV
jgi:apyrase